MGMAKHKVFISYHHENDQSYKDALVKWNESVEAFIDKSVDTGDISDELTDEEIRVKIRDEYLRDSTVTIVLVGTDTAGRKHVDWEIYSSMKDGPVNKKSGIVIILLPSVTGASPHICVANGDAEKALYPQIKDWKPLDARENLMWGGLEKVPERIIDNIVKGAKISVTAWNEIVRDPSILGKLIDMANSNKDAVEYDFSRPMRRHNS